MTVSIETHRSRIGLYSLSSTRKSLVFRVKSAKALETFNHFINMKRNHGQCLCILLYILMCLRLVNCPPANQTTTSSNGMTLSQPRRTGSRNIFSALTHIRWDSGLTINKLCHIKFGNRRNFGYKYLSWNCDRGFFIT